MVEARQPAAAGGAATADKEKKTAVVTTVKAQSGSFSPAILQKQLEQVKEAGAIFTLSVSTVLDERVFFFTRGAILFAATGVTGGHVLERKLVARRYLSQQKLDELSALTTDKNPLIQDVIREREAMNPDVLQKVVEELMEEHLLEIATWDPKTSFYEIVWGNPPPKLYTKNAAVRLSFGLTPLITRVLPKIAEVVDKVTKPLGSMSNRVAPIGGAAARSDVEAAVLQGVRDGRSCLQAIAPAVIQGVPPFAAAESLAQLASSRRVIIKDGAPSKQEEIAIAGGIEGALDQFVNGLLVRLHLAGIYERVKDTEKAVEQYRALAAEHMARDRVNDALSALAKAVKLDPTDLAVREDLVKAYRAAGRVAEAAKEAVELARLLLTRGLPGRARQALEVALKLQPHNLGILWMLAGLLEKLGLKEEAIKRYRQIAESAQQQHDEPSYIAAMQRILELNPSDESILRDVQEHSGYRRQLIVRGAIGVSIVILTLVLLGYVTYEIFALRAFKDAQERAWSAVDEEHYDIARSIMADFERSWTISRFKKLVPSFVDEIASEEALAKDRRLAKAVRVSRALEQEKRVPEAAEIVKAALQGEDRREKRDVLERLSQRYEQRLKEAKESIEEARSLARQRGRERSAYDLMLQASLNTPWVTKQADFRVPCLVETEPKGASVSLDGIQVDQSSPVWVDLPLQQVRLRVSANNHEPVGVVVGPNFPVCPITVGLPRRRLWSIPEAAGPSAPVLAPRLVIAACDDRSVVAVSPETGDVTWRAALGVFGETELAPVVGPGVVVVRTTDGALVALDLQSGKHRWRAPLRPLGEDVQDASLARPAAAGDGFVALDGPQTVAFVAAADGAVRWRAPIRGSIAGAPSAWGDFVCVVAGRAVHAFWRVNGSQAWTAALPLPSVTGGVTGPRACLCVGLEGGYVAWLDRNGAVLMNQQCVTGAISAIDGSNERIVVGSVTGELASANELRARVAFRVTLKQGVPVRFVLSPVRDLIIASDGKTLTTTNGAGVVQWRDATNGAPACGDDYRVYQSGPGGLISIER